MSTTIHLEALRNVRDLGGTPVGGACGLDGTRGPNGTPSSGATSAHDGARRVKSGLILRGAALAGASAADLDALFGEHGVKCVIDLRCGWERAAKPDPYVDGVENLHIPFYDKDIVGLEYTKKVPGTIRIGHDFACDQVDFYRSTANPATVAQMARALDALFTRAMSGIPVYLHCTGGKDRAGILAALALEVLEAQPDAVLCDYLATNASRDAHIQGTYERFLRLCEGDEMRARELCDAHRASPQNIGAFLDEVDERYGGMESFITHQLGIDATRRTRLQEALTEPAL